MVRQLWAPRIDRQRKYELVTRDDGSFELIDNSKVPYVPTEEQIEFLEKWLWDWEYNLNIKTAITAVGGGIRDYKYWRRDPAFVQLMKTEIAKRFDGTIEEAKMVLAAAAEDADLELTKQQKWAIKQIMRVDEALRAAEMKVLQINMKDSNINIYGASMDMSEEQLERIIHDGTNEAVAQGIIEGGSSQGSGGDTTDQA